MTIEIGYCALVLALTTAFTSRAGDRRCEPAMTNVASVGLLEGR
ncbi:hypothetical protein [Rhizobium laguerreae]|nr:hypothetical protein [Rhizobium laguerreae]